MPTYIPIKSYDPAAVSFSLGGKVAAGFSDNTFITLARNADAYSLKVGADGTSTRAKSNNRSGRATLVLAQSADYNDYLSSLAAADELSGAGIVPMIMRDASGRTVASAVTMWVVKLPDGAFGNETGDREWVLETDSLTYFVGGN